MQIRHLDSQVSDRDEQFQQKNRDSSKRRHAIRLLSLLTVIFYTGTSEVAQGVVPGQIDPLIDTYKIYTGIGWYNNLDTQITATTGILENRGEVENKAVGAMTNNNYVKNSNGYGTSGTITNKGTIDNNKYFYNGFGGGTGTLDNYGTINANSSGNFANGYNPSGSVNTGSGTLNNYLGAFFNNSGLFYNGVKNNGTVNNWGAFTNNSAGTIFNGNGSGGTHIINQIGVFKRSITSRSVIFSHPRQIP